MRGDCLSGTSNSCKNCGFAERHPVTFSLCGHAEFTARVLHALVNPNANAISNFYAVRRDTIHLNSVGRAFKGELPRTSG